LQAQKATTTQPYPTTINQQATVYKDFDYEIHPSINQLKTLGCK
jgi:hypothetical protein